MNKILIFTKINKTKKTNHMRLLLILTVLLLSTKSYTQDIVDIPDPNFKQALI